MMSPREGQTSVNGDQISHQFGSVRSRCSHHRPSTAPITRFINRPPTNRIFQCPAGKKIDFLPIHRLLLVVFSRDVYSENIKGIQNILRMFLLVIISITLDVLGHGSIGLERFLTSLHEFFYFGNSRVEVLLFSEHSLRFRQNNYQKYGLELPPTQDASHYQDYYINE